MFNIDKVSGQQPKKDLFLIFSIISLVLFSVLFVLLTLSYYQKRIKAISLSENRYLTTEWRLLHELKAQSDQKLMEKDKEIAELNRRYLELARGNASATELRQIEIQLQQAEEEREEILSNQVDTTAETGQEQDEWIADLLPSENRSAVTILLETQITLLEIKLNENQKYISELENERAELLAKQEKNSQEYMKKLTEKLTEIKKQSAEITGLKGILDDTLTDLKRKAQEKIDRPRMEDLNTLALIRAIINEQEIETDYPGLLEQLDRFMDTYGLQERQKGQRQAYAEAAKALDRKLDGSHP